MADLLAAALDAPPINVAFDGTGATQVLAALDASKTPILLGCVLRVQTDAVTVKVQSSDADAAKTIHGTWKLDSGEELVLKVKDYESIRANDGEALELVVSGSSPELFGTAWVSDID